MNRRGWELVTTDELVFVAKSFRNPIVVENGKGDTGLPNPPRTDESDWTKVFSEMDNLLD